VAVERRVLGFSLANLSVRRRPGLHLAPAFRTLHRKYATRQTRRPLCVPFSVLGRERIESVLSQRSSRFRPASSFKAGLPRCRIMRPAFASLYTLHEISASANMTAPGAWSTPLYKDVSTFLVLGAPASLIRVGALTLRGSGLLLLVSVVGRGAPL
jgi:hypothetical protein